MTNYKIEFSILCIGKLSDKERDLEGSVEQLNRTREDLRSSRNDITVATVILIIIVFICVFIIGILCVILWRKCKESTKNESPKGTEFQIRYPHLYPSPLRRAPLPVYRRGIMSCPDGRLLYDLHPGIPHHDPYSSYPGFSERPSDRGNAPLY